MTRELPFREEPSSWLAALVFLLGWFFVQVVLSGITTAWIIVRPGQRPQPGLVRMSFDGLSETGAAILGCLLTLTPGSTTLDVDLERQEILLHLLDASNPQVMVRRVRRHFEMPLKRLFPAREAT